MNKRYKIMGWNINQRSGFVNSRGYGRRIPELVTDEIVDQKADIVVLTEFFYCSNAKAFLNRTFTEQGYCYKTTTNMNTNEILIAWRQDHFLKTGEESAISRRGNNVPNYLRLDLVERDNGGLFSVGGVRIRDVESIKKQEEMGFIAGKLEKINNRPIILIGSFSNNRRGATNPNWNLKVLDKMLGETKLIRHTPQGQSINYERSRRGYPYEMAEDHIIVSQMLVEEEAYDRDFVYRNPKAYPWQKDFQYMNQRGEYETVEPGFPDHAIIRGYFQRKAE